MKLLIKILFISFFCGTLGFVHAQINVLPNQTALLLAQKLTGTGVTILNPVLNCPSNANGFFSVVSSSIGLDSGIVLTNGQAATVIGYKNGVNGPSSVLASNNNAATGDPALDSLAATSITYDACDLEFDVIPYGDTVSFNYLFSSEEYINAVCYKYNDAFAFFISGPGIATKDNMALVPGTNIPVTINSINDGVPGKLGDISYCTAMGPGSPFTSFYIDNSTGTTLTHKGFTTVLKAFHAVTPCNTYHLKMEIVDADDALYDSGVFLQAGSLHTNSYVVDALTTNIHDIASPICVKGCLPGTFQVKGAQVSSTPQAIHFFTSGTAVSGYDFVPLIDSVIIPAYATSANITVTGLPTPLNSVKTLNLYLLAPNCTSLNNIVDSATMLIYDTPYISISPVDTFICGSENVQFIVKTDNIYSFNWSPAYNISSTTVETPTVYPAVNTIYEVTMSLPGTACIPKTAQASFIIRQTPEIVLPSDTQVCYHATFPLNAIVTNPNSNYTYTWSGSTGFTATILNPYIDTVTAQGQGIYTLTVVNDTNACSSTAAINITVNIPDTPQVTNPLQFCYNTTSGTLTASGNNLLWYTSSTTDTASAVALVIPVNATAVYVYYVTQNINGCESPRAMVVAIVEQCCNGNIFIPSAFTPNNDGLNDKFMIYPDFGYFIKKVMVYNRWGQLVYNDVVAAWDGTYLHQEADLGVYYYIISLGCVLGGPDVQVKGDVMLMR